MYASVRLPYVGITGITTTEQLRYLENLLKQLDWPDTHKVMNGVLLSEKVLNGGEPSRPTRYPPLQRIPKLMSRDNRIINVIHYNSRDPMLYAQLRRVVKLSPLIVGVQLNIPWPERSQLQLYRSDMTTSPWLILQIGAGAYRQVGDRPHHLARRLEHYLGCIESVLLDPSGGEGKVLDPEALRAQLSALRFYDFSSGVAGGLAADNVQELIGPLRADFPGINWDAEGRLRTPDDQLDLEACEAYLRACRELLR